jgi:hypothetical protein
MMSSGTAERARTIATLAGVALRAIEAGELAARVEALESVLRGREAAACAVRVLSLGVPPTVVGINPLDYTEYPLRILERAMAQAG